jgi:hypothetical protein
MQQIPVFYFGGSDGHGTMLAPVLDFRTPDV